MQIGFHMSIAGSIDEAVDRAIETRINTFQMFTHSPRGWQLDSLDIKEVNLFKEKLGKVKIKPVFVHMPYLPNLASPKKEVYALSIKTLRAELHRCNQLDIPFLITHMGSHVGSGKVMGLKRIVEAVNNVLAETCGKAMLLFENTAGTENSMGSSFEDIKKIVDKIYLNEKIGICFDTCHAFAAGYDLRGRENVERTLTILDSVLGLKRIKVLHLNDSLGGLRSHLDRHEHIGLGKIGEEGFKAILNSEFRKYPLILETPIDHRRDNFGNLMKVKALAKQ